MTPKIKWKTIIPIIVTIIVLIGMISPMKEKLIKARGVKYNHCLEEKSYYFRSEGGFLFTSKVKTTEEQADGLDWECLEWEEEPSVGKAVLGQELIHEKGFSNRGKNNV
jgi:hypothetical protein